MGTGKRQVLGVRASSPTVESAVEVSAPSYSCVCDSTRSRRNSLLQVSTGKGTYTRSPSTCQPVALPQQDTNDCRCFRGVWEQRGVYQPHALRPAHASHRSEMGVCGSPGAAQIEPGGGGGKDDHVSVHHLLHCGV